MERIVRKTYPDCDKDPNGCFERFVKDRLQHMKDMKLSHLTIGEFDSSYDLVLKKVAAELNGESEHNFWWNTRSRTIAGTVHDRFVYIMDLYMKTE